MIEKGPVKKGALLGYLGDADENGGSAEQPLVPHLHLGIRAGQRADYTGSGEWRWMAGWITPCPSDLGWLQPSAVITAQQIPPGGFENPTGGLLERWGIELLLAAVYLAGGIFVVIYGIRGDKPAAPLLYGGLMLVATFILNQKEFKIGPLLFAFALLLMAIGLYLLIRRARKRRKHEPTG